MMATGVINATFAKGRKIPDQLSIIGYDDISITKFMVPPLIIVHKPKYQLGRTAVDTLLLCIKNKEMKP